MGVALRNYFGMDGRKGKLAHLCAFLFYKIFEVIRKEW